MVAGNDSNGERTRPRRSTGWSATVVIVGGYNRVGGYNTPYVHAYDPSINEWTSLAKLPTFTKSEYAVATFRNTIIISGGRVHSRDVWLYQVCKPTNPMTLFESIRENYFSSDQIKDGSISSYHML